MTTMSIKPVSIAVAEGSAGKGHCKRSLFRYQGGSITQCCLVGALAITYLGEDECMRLTAPEHPDGASRDGEAYNALRNKVPWLFKGEAGIEVLRMMNLREKDVVYLTEEGYIRGDLASCLAYANDELADGFNRALEALNKLSCERNEISVTYHLIDKQLAVR